MSSAEVSIPRSTTALVVMFASLLFYTALDLGTKEWALGALSKERVGDKPGLCIPGPSGYPEMQRIPTEHQTLIEGYLVLHYAENCGAAFGMLRTAPVWVRATVFGLAAIGAFVVLTLMFKRGSGGPLFAAAVPLILSGAVGNLADRVRHGFVVDFIQVDPNWFNYPTFNVADISIFIGVALLMIDGIRKPSSTPEPKVDAGRATAQD
jgi:signal peptidase II